MQAEGRHGRKRGHPGQAQGCGAGALMRGAVCGRIGRERGNSRPALDRRGPWILAGGSAVGCFGLRVVFAGFLLLSGRVADLWGRRRTFIAGLALFTAASLGCGLPGSPGVVGGGRRRGASLAGLGPFPAASLSCGLSVSPEMLVASRAVQGLGAAITAPAALSIITTIFEEGAARGRRGAPRAA